MPTLSPTTEEIWYALVESVKLQSHYATLLNQHDGGGRKTFADPHAWIQRLREVADTAAHGASVRTFEARLERNAAQCRHVHVKRGKDAPRVYGSWRTQVCLDCGAFRTHGHNDEPEPSKPWAGHDWQPASEYADATAKREDE